MAIETQCRCGRVVKVRDELKGRHIRCPECKEVMVVKARRLPRLKKKKTSAPRRRSTASAASYDAFAAPERAPEATSKPKPKPKPKSKSKSKRWRETPPPGESRDSGGYGTLSTVGLVLLSMIGFGLKVSNRLHRISGRSSSSAATASSDSSGSLFSGLFASASSVADPYDVSDVPVPEFPVLPPARLSVAGVDIHQFTLNGDKDVAGHRMTLRVYLPQGAAADGSRTCVLVAPAGSTLLVGNSIDGMDYHDETLPYALDGCVVVMYSLDGQQPSELLSDYMYNMALQSAFQQFMQARAGLVNARNALEFVLARLPQVDPSKIYSAGHSSAGTLSLQLAAAQPRLAGSIAYAPVSNLRFRLGEFADDPEFAAALPGIGNYLDTYSPQQMAGRMQRPLFLFHAADDGNVPISQSNRLSQSVPNPARLEYVTVPTGNHYNSMIDEGIPAARAWLRRQTAQSR